MQLGGFLLNFTNRFNAAAILVVVRMHPMDSVQLCSLIEALVAQPKKTQKVELFAAHSNNEALRRGLDLAMNSIARFWWRDLQETRQEGKKGLGVGNHAKSTADSLGRIEDIIESAAAT